MLLKESLAKHWTMHDMGVVAKMSLFWPQRQSCTLISEKYSLTFVKEKVQTVMKR